MDIHDTDALKRLRLEDLLKPKTVHFVCGCPASQNRSWRDGFTGELEEVNCQQCLDILLEHVKRVKKAYSSGR